MTRKLPLRTKECVICHQIFQIKNIRAKYCSPKCKSTASIIWAREHPGYMAQAQKQYLKNPIHRELRRTYQKKYKQRVESKNRRAILGKRRYKNDLDYLWTAIMLIFGRCRLITPHGEIEIELEEKREGIVSIAQTVILDWLKFQGGHIRGVRHDFSGNIELLIEHPDMPSHIDSYAPEVVTPTYQISYPDKIVTRNSPIRDASTWLDTTKTIDKAGEHDTTF